jgi:AhpD family alkylhydroperoxidase
MRQDSGSAAAERVSIGAVDPHALRVVGGLDRYAVSGTLGEELLSLVRLRASQLNGCAYCLDLHAGEARAAGVTQRQLDVLAAYREAASLFSARQLAALRLTDAVTHLGRDGVPDEAWDPVAEQFDDAETVQLLTAICAINAWNRLAISTRQALPAGGR